MCCPTYVITVHNKRLKLHADKPACYPIVSQLQTDFVCVASYKVLVYRKQTEDNFDVPGKLTVTGMITLIPKVI